MRRLLLVTLALLLPVGLAGAQSGPLRGSVTAAAAISLVDAAGADVTKLPTGVAAFQVSDTTPDHNFHLSGPGVNERTGVAQTGSVTWNVTLVDGTYSYVCDVHPSDMNGEITVGTGGSGGGSGGGGSGGGGSGGDGSGGGGSGGGSGGGTTTAALAGKVGPGRTIVLTSGARRVTKLTAGSYTVVVTDASTTDNFHLKGPGVDRKTSVAGKQTVSWMVTLKKGTYTFRSDASGTLRGSFVVS